MLSDFYQFCEYSIWIMIYVMVLITNKFDLLNQPNDDKNHGRINTLRDKGELTNCWSKYHLHWSYPEG